MSQSSEEWGIYPHVLSQLVALSMGAVPVGAGLLLGRVVERMRHTVTDEIQSMRTVQRTVSIEALTTLPVAKDDVGRVYSRRLWDGCGIPSWPAFEASVEQSLGAGWRATSGLRIVGAWVLRAGTPASLGQTEGMVLRQLAASATGAGPANGVPAGISWGGEGSGLLCSSPVLLVVGSEPVGMVPSSLPAVGSDNEGVAATVRSWHKAWVCPLRPSLTEMITKGSSEPEAAEAAATADVEEGDQEAEPEEAATSAVEPAWTMEELLEWCDAISEKLDCQSIPLKMLGTVTQASDAEEESTGTREELKPMIKTLVTSLTEGVGAVAATESRMKRAIAEIAEAEAAGLEARLTCRAVIN
jgi:hypothetical protein